jgi:hypothetical protein
MSIFQDIIKIVDDIKDTSKSIGNVRGNLQTGTDLVTSGEERFFTRPRSSIASTAKKSILYFPVIASENLNIDTVGILAKAIQVRATEYIRLWISNLDPQKFDTTSKSDIISALRGATLDDPMLKERVELVSKYLGKNLNELVECIIIENELNEPLEKKLIYLDEAIRPKKLGANTSKNQFAHYQDDDYRLILNRVGTPTANPTLIRDALKYYRNNNSPTKYQDLLNRLNLNARTEIERNIVPTIDFKSNDEFVTKLKDIDELLRNGNSFDRINAHKEIKKLYAQDPLEAKRILNQRRRTSPDLNNLLTNLERDPNFLDNFGNDIISDVELKKTMTDVSSLLRRNNVGNQKKAYELVKKLYNQDPVKTLTALQTGSQTNPDLSHLFDIFNNDPDEYDRQQLQTTKDADERRELTTSLNTVNSLIKSNTIGSRALAIQTAQQMMAKNPVEARKLLKANDDTKKIYELISTLPGEIAKDGSYDISGRSNKIQQAKAVDFNKLNAFQPVLLDLDLKFVADGNHFTDKISLGVKSVAHMIPGSDLITGLGTALQRDSFILQFFRMTSGETSFLTDFVLNLKVARDRASSKTSYGTKILEKLRRQSEWNERRSNFVIQSISKRGFVPPTATIVISTDEVEKINNIYGIDFNSVGNVRKLLTSHNLMGFIIIDENIGLAKVFEDGDGDFDRVPITSLKDQGKDTNIKDIITLMARR